VVSLKFIVWFYFLCLVILVFVFFKFLGFFKILMY